MRKLLIAFILLPCVAFSQYHASDIGIAASIRGYVGLAYNRYSNFYKWGWGIGAMRDFSGKEINIHTNGYTLGHKVESTHITANYEHAVISSWLGADINGNLGISDSYSPLYDNHKSNDFMKGIGADIIITPKRIVGEGPNPIFRFGFNTTFGFIGTIEVKI